jgi:hypothetical protein
MQNPNHKSRKFKGLSYREVQRHNSAQRGKLKPEEQKWLKENSYKNVGWDNVIHLYEKIEEFLEQNQIEDLSLEELFLEADRIGNKYLTNQEIEDFNQKLSQEVNEISELIDQQFPDTEIEVIDFNQPTQKIKKKSNQKSYKTIKSP